MKNCCRTELNFALVIYLIATVSNFFALLMLLSVILKNDKVIFEVLPGKLNVMSESIVVDPFISELFTL